ncbi:MAG: DUF962 domain-containing protein [Pseudomonadota bacterium]|jgi:uncharacterized membrane protein YGL010W|nr:MAG: DUF962 domain-containing protein [Pseudomonadota bacterium]
MTRVLTRDEWIARYERSHQHPVNRACHAVGIPMIVFSVLLGLASIAVVNLRVPALLLFVVGWLLQFVGHAFEGKPPEFFRDWRFLFVGLRWWMMKVTGRI